ncbi:MAG TPA: hypothetical protein VK846_04470 [Candidatus Limnocylindria bacterium]|nr:hypothetical protein [Candidatus Limnocylindria bacterium]
MNATTGKFNEILATVEKLPVEDQATLVELVNKRIAAARRMEMAREIAEARGEYRRGKVKRGSAADLMRDLRGK